MDEDRVGLFPLPSTRQGWGTAIVVSVLLFGLYYILIYKICDDIYAKQFITTERVESLDTPGIGVTIDIPRFVTSFSDSELTTYIFNESGVSQDLSVIVSSRLSVKKEDNSGSDELADIGDTGGEKTQSVIISSEVNSDINLSNSNSELDFGVIAPNAVASKTNWIRVHNFSIFNPIEFNFYLLTNGKPEMLYVRTKTVAILDPVSSFLVFVLRQILLPPIANGLIPLIALISAYSLEPVYSDERLTKLKINIPKFLQFRRWYLAVFFRALFVIIIPAFMVAIYFGIINGIYSWLGYYIADWAKAILIIACLALFGMGTHFFASQLIRRLVFSIALPSQLNTLCSFYLNDRTDVQMLERRLLEVLKSSTVDKVKECIKKNDGLVQRLFEGSFDPFDVPVEGTNLGKILVNFARQNKIDIDVILRRTIDKQGMAAAHTCFGTEVCIDYLLSMDKENDQIRSQWKELLGYAYQDRLRNEPVPVGKFQDFIRKGKRVFNIENHLFNVLDQNPAAVNDESDKLIELYFYYVEIEQKFMVWLKSSVEKEKVEADHRNAFREKFGQRLRGKNSSMSPYCDLLNWLDSVTV